MGKKRIAVIGDEAKTPKKPSKKGRQVLPAGRQVVKSGKEHGRITDVGAEALAEAEAIKAKAEKLEKEVAAKTTKKVKKKAKPARKRGKRYQAAKKLVDRTRLYPLSEAIKLLKKTSITKFNSTVEAHLASRETGLKTEVTFPYQAGKAAKVAIANESVLKKIEKGKIDFTLLISTPEMMPKLAKYARFLGPKGLMPNPKAGTITKNPKVLAKKFAGKTQVRTEAKAPLIHAVIGKVDQPEKELVANFQALVNAVAPKNILKATLTSTMGPGIKIDLTKI